MNLSQCLAYNGFVKAPHTYERQNKHFTESDIEFIRDNYQRMTDTEIGYKLNRNDLSIRLKRFELGLMKVEKKKMSNSDIKFIEENYKNMPRREIAEALNCSINNVKYWVRKFREAA